MSLVSLVLLLILVAVVVRGAVRSTEGRLPPGAGVHSPAELEAIREELDDVRIRLQHLEEERDFYKDLLEAPDRSELLGAPGRAEMDEGSDEPKGS